MNIFWKSDFQYFAYSQSNMFRSVIRHPFESFLLWEKWNCCNVKCFSSSLFTTAVLNVNGQRLEGDKGTQESFMEYCTPVLAQYSLFENECKKFRSLVLLFVYLWNVCTKIIICFILNNIVQYQKLILYFNNICWMIL